MSIYILEDHRCQGQIQDLERGVQVTVKPVFHQKQPSRWVIFTYPMRKKLHKQHEMYMANATCSHWGFALGVTHILRFTLEVTQILGFALAPQGFLDTNMLVFPMQNSRGGGIA